MQKLSLIFFLFHDFRYTVTTRRALQGAERYLFQRMAESNGVYRMGYPIFLYYRLGVVCSYLLFLGSRVLSRDTKS